MQYVVTEKLIRLYSICIPLDHCVHVCCMKRCFVGIFVQCICSSWIVLPVLSLVSHNINPFVQYSSSFLVYHLLFQHSYIAVIVCSSVSSIFCCSRDPFA